MTDLTEFNPKSLSEKITEKIRAQFLDLIPNDVFKTMVENQVKAFQQERESDSSYSREKKPSMLNELIQEEIKRRLLISVSTELDKEEYQILWENGKNIPGAAITKLIKENASELVAQMFGLIVGESVNRFRQELHR